MVSEEPPSPLDPSRESPAPEETATPPVTELAPALMKASCPESAIELTVPKLAVTWGLPPVLITTSLEAVGTPALQSPGVFQLAVPSVQLSSDAVAAACEARSIVLRRLRVGRAKGGFNLRQKLRQAWRDVRGGPKRSQGSPFRDAIFPETRRRN